jgi:hypothetical protein
LPAIVIVDCKKTAQMIATWAVRRETGIVVTQPLAPKVLVACLAVGLKMISELGAPTVKRADVIVEFVINTSNGCFGTGPVNEACTFMRRCSCRGHRRIPRNSSFE